MEVKSFTVKTLSQDATHASVVARLAPNNWVRKSERENEIQCDLVWERLGAGRGGSLNQMLRIVSKGVCGDLARARR